MITRRAFSKGLLLLPITPATVRAERQVFWPNRLVQAARAQIGITLSYDPSYVGLAYPGGDPPRDRGVCTDVIVRAYRDAFGMDLQAVIHEDMKRAFRSYPSNWGLSRPDPNIDHRRVQNLERFFERAGFEVDVPEHVHDVRAGDVCTMRLPGNLPHIVIASDRDTPSGRPLVIHNVGRGTREEDFFDRFPPTRCFRVVPPQLRLSEEK